jgi:DNA-binding GntR family transcriptional regulator
MDDDQLGGRQVRPAVPVRDQVAAIIRDAIVEMRVLPGEVLIERQLCAMTAASRPSVREALRQLQAEGLVESVNGRGTVVSRVGPDLAAQVYRVRGELEGLASELFTLNATPQQVEDFHRAVETFVVLAESDDPDLQRKALAAKNDLYAILFAGAGNQVLHDTVGTLQRRVAQLRALTMAQPGRAVESAREIRAIDDAIARRDHVAARAAATAHVARAATVLESITAGAQEVGEQA